MIEKVANVAQYGGAGVAGVSGAKNLVLGLTTDEWSVVGIVVGICIGLAGFAVSTWFQWRRDQREARE